MLGLPDRVKACLFDVDGVLTQTAKVHAAAWKEMFDGYLRARADSRGDRFAAFDPVGDYDAYVDGKPRADGTRSFLAARGINLPGGSPDDPPGAWTVQGLGNRKNDILLRRIRQHGVQAYDGSVRSARAARAAGLRCAVVSSSKNSAACSPRPGSRACSGNGSMA
jgi:beta-phosphoglucomutase-like phosphatase (HAD superfamily)